MAHSLHVYRDGILVGALFDERPLRFAYDAQWLNSPAARPIAPMFPLRLESFSGDQVYAFFENLLPEGPVRRLLQAGRHTSSVFGLLRSVAGDTAGGLTLLPEGELPHTPAYHATSWQHIAEQLRQGRAPTLGAQSAGDMRISLAGAQDKLLLMILPDGRPAIPHGASPSSHILKPDIRGLPGVWSSALNEALVMKLAMELGLGVAQADYQPETGACLIRRYDRRMDGHGGLVRLHQLDVCQLAGIPSDVKYESDGGPSLVRCCDLLRDAGIAASDLKRLVQWVIFNLYVGNHDSHAKNLSVLANEHGWQLSPFYDLMCTTLYPGLSRRFAFRIGDTNVPGRIGLPQIHAMAKSLGMAPNYVLKLALEMGLSLPLLLEKTVTELKPLAQAGTEHTLIDRLSRRILRETRKYTRRWGL